MPRLFTAVYPSEAALDHLDAAIGSLGAIGTTARMVPRAQRHVTLAFHGEVPAGAIPDYLWALEHQLAAPTPPELLAGWSEAAGPAGAAPGGFETELAGSGVFGGRALWVGTGAGTEQLRHLARQVDQIADEAGIRSDNRAGGRPHLTLARATAAHRGKQARARRQQRQQRQQPGDAEPGENPFLAWTAALAVYRGPLWPVHSIAVVESVLGAGRGGGPHHEVIAQAQLSSAART